MTLHLHPLIHAAAAGIVFALTASASAQEPSLQPRPPSAEEGHRPEWYAALAPWLSRIPDQSPGIEAERLRSASLASYADAADALPDPMISIGTQAVPTNFDFTSEPMTMAPALMIRQVIPWPGKLAAKRKLLKAEEGTAVQQARIDEETQGLRLAAAAFTMARIESEVAALSESLEWLNLLYDSADARYRSGLGAGYDVDQIEVERGRLLADGSRLAAELEQARATWFEVLGTRAPADLSLEREGVKSEKTWAPGDELVETIRTKNPGVKMAALMTELAEHSVALEKSGYAPDFTAELGYGFRHAGRRDLVTGSIGITVPLWAPWSQRSQVEGALLAARSRSLRLDEMQREAGAMAQRTLAELQEAGIRESLYAERIVPAALRGRKSAQSAYEAGGEDIFVPIESIRRHLQTIREQAKVTAERRFLEARLVGLSGNLVRVHAQENEQ